LEGGEGGANRQHHREINYPMIKLFGIRQN
jgi:hypothetical protein